MSVNRLRYHNLQINGKMFEVWTKLDDDGFFGEDSTGWQSRRYARERDAEVACDDRIEEIIQEVRNGQ